MLQQFPLHCRRTRYFFAFGINQTRGDDINPDVPRPQLLGQCHRGYPKKRKIRTIEPRIKW
jgi:hypothetical protein